MSVKKNVLFAKKGMSLEFLSNSHSISIIIPPPPPQKKKIDFKIATCLVF